MARVLSFKFKANGYTTIVCADGKYAWEAFESNSVSAIVTDHEMPNLSGLALCRKVRAKDSLIPLFLVTGRELELPPGVCEELRIAEIFGKPFSPAKVVAAVNDAIKESSTHS